MCNIIAIKEQNKGHTTKAMSYLHLLVTFHPGQNNIFFKGPVVQYCYLNHTMYLGSTTIYQGIKHSKHN